VRRALTVAVGAVGLALTVAGPASATPITSPGGGESFNIHPGDSFKVGYDFTIPGNNESVTVTWTNPKAVVNFTCPGGSSGSFTIPMPDYTVTVSDSQWYPSGDQHSSLVYQGSVTAPDGCGNGTVMHQNKIAVFTADVTSTPPGVKLNYRFHDADNNASGSWSSTNSVVTSSAAKPGIKLTKTVCALVNGSDCTSPGSVFASSLTEPAGTNVLYLIVITNTGQTTLTNVTTNDPAIPDCAGLVTGSLAAGATTQYFCGQTTVNQNFTNTASATGTTPSGTTVTSPDSSATVNV
jgi:uncharacterized repeat protein (TIGR01451 family)